MEKKIFSNLNKILLIILCFFFINCSKIIEQNGVLPSEENLQKIKNGITTKNQVRKLLGEPLIIDGDNSNSWIYFSQRIEKHTFLEPKLISRYVVLLSFKNNILKEIEKFSIQDSKVVEISTNKVVSGGRKLTFLQQIFGNIGNFSAQNFQKN